jgi:hypothetical protein
MPVEKILKDIHAAEVKLHDALKARAKKFHYVIERHRVRFDDAVHKYHKTLRQGLWSFVTGSGILAVLGAPFIYAIFIPLLMLDISLNIYQFATSIFYGIKKERRGDYITIDRQYLAYLNSFQKFNCVYCGYANGLLAWGRAIAGQSEAHFCPIKHARRTQGQHEEYWGFLDYGDAEAWLKHREERRKKG